MTTFSSGGGSGFIGTSLSSLLRKCGYDVVIISRVPSAFSMTWGDLEKNGLPKNTTAVVSLAGQNILDMKRRWNAGFQQTVSASRINTTQTLARAIERAEIKPNVFVSTSGVGKIVLHIFIKKSCLDILKSSKATIHHIPQKSTLKILKVVQVTTLLNCALNGKQRQNYPLIVMFVKLSSAQVILPVLRQRMLF